MMRTANPALNDKTFGSFGAEFAHETSDVMTLQGTVTKTGFLLVILVAAGAFTWKLTYQSQSLGSVVPWLIGGLIGGLIFGLITAFKPTASPYTAPVYAAFEGLFLGAISAMFEQMYPGIVVQAVGLTFGTLAALLIAYTSGLIKPTENFKLGGHGRDRGGDAPVHGVVRVGDVRGKHRLHPRLGPVRDRVQRGGDRHRGIEPGAGLRLHRDRRRARRTEILWSGTARLVCWSRSSGCTWRSCACWRSCGTVEEEAVSC